MNPIIVNHFPFTIRQSILIDKMSFSKENQFHHSKCNVKMAVAAKDKASWYHIMKLMKCIYWRLKQTKFTIANVL